MTILTARMLTHHDTTWTNLVGGAELVVVELPLKELKVRVTVLAGENLAPRQHKISRTACVH
jgi:hypothetical protein